MAIKDLTGQKFGRLTVVEMAPKTTRKTFWKCICECGNEKVVRSDCLQRKQVKSCGCYNVDARKTHGLSDTRLYGIWTHMIHRCYDEKDISYPNYGGRGIAVCDEWRNDFESFYRWATKNGYDDKLSIDRLNVNGNYEPTNCKWSTKREQDKNKRTTAFTIYFGKKISILELSEITGIKYSILNKRHFRGDTNERLTRPIRIRNNQTAI